jgi:hypothetical protein
MKAIDPVPAPSQGNEETFSDGGGSNGFFQNDDDTDVDDNDPRMLSLVRSLMSSVQEMRTRQHQTTTQQCHCQFPSLEGGNVRKLLDMCSS